MYEGVLSFHSILRWCFLVLLFINIVRSLFPTLKHYNNENLKWGQWLLVCTYFNLATAIYLYLFGRYGITLLKNQGYRYSDIFNIPYLRFWLIEHPSLMLLSMIIISSAHKVSKSNSLLDNKYRLMSILYIMALCIILSAIPWPFRNLEFARQVVTRIN